MYGHAKNKRFDLKQMTLLLATTGKNGFPVWIKSHSGNASDQKTLELAAQRMQKLCQAIKDAPPLLFVGDSAMYAHCVENGANLLWLSRVPDKIKLSKELLLKNDVNWTKLANGYKISCSRQVYKNVEQRWVLVFSQEAYDKEIKTLEKNIDKEYEEFSKELWHMCNQIFGCQKDLEGALQQFSKKLKYHQLDYQISDSLSRKKIARFKLTAKLIKNQEAINNARLTKGKFILATNQLDAQVLKDEEILPAYKEQSGTKSGFKFIKDNAFEVDSIF